jgi:hypothetical protein
VHFPEGPSDDESQPPISDNEVYQGRATMFDEKAVDLLDNPEFIPRGSVLGGQVNEDNGDRAESEDADEPSVVDDHPAIRNAYVRAFVAPLFAGSTHKAVHLA